MVVGGGRMFETQVQNTNNSLGTKKEMYYDDIKKVKNERAVRYFDMQNIVSAGLAGAQQSVNNAENYPSTWTTNPDGGANGQV